MLARTQQEPDLWLSFRQTGSQLAGTS